MFRCPGSPGFRADKLTDRWASGADEREGLSLDALGVEWYQP